MTIPLIVIISITDDAYRTFARTKEPENLISHSHSIHWSRSKGCHLLVLLNGSTMGLVQTEAIFKCFRIDMVVLSSRRQEKFVGLVPRLACGSFDPRLDSPGNSSRLKITARKNS